jgi:menaquinol-cytochrome c reductase iron-sulfur subunit
LATHAQVPSGGASHPQALSAYDLPGTYEEISRRKFMANATLTISGLIGLGLAIPIVGSLVPDVGSDGATWTGLDEAGWNELQAATNTPVQIDIKLTTKDAYLPEQGAPESVYGIKVKDPSKFRMDRSDIFVNGKDTLPYGVANLGFVIFSPICPHLGCRYQWKAELNRFACPCHGSQFDRDGAHIAGPAARGLDPLPLREQSGKAEVEWIRFQPTVPSRIVISYTS